MFLQNLLKGKQHIHLTWFRFANALCVCACVCVLTEELTRCNEVIGVLTKHVWVVESREKELQKELDEAKKLFCELEKKQQQVNQKCQDYEVMSMCPSIQSVVFAGHIYSLSIVKYLIIME